jgi:post-segregation antitoxin (ccd killing protein)
MEKYAMDTKSNITVYLNVELANLAREMGLNLLKTCENALKTAINRLQGFNVENNGEQRQVSTQNSDEWTERDLNPPYGLLISGVLLSLGS